MKIFLMIAGLKLFLCLSTSNLIQIKNRLKNLPYSVRHLFELKYFSVKRKSLVSLISVREVSLFSFFLVYGCIFY